MAVTGESSTECLAEAYDDDKNDDNDENNNNNKDDDDDDDDLGMMMDVFVPSVDIIDSQEGGVNTNNNTSNNKPLTFSVDDRAIMDCWDLSVRSHEQEKETAIADTNSNNNNNNNNDDGGGGGEEGINGITSIDMTKSLALPSWAVDPFEMSIVINQSLIKSKPK